MPGTEQKRTLVVSDDHETGSLIRDVLAGAGFAVGLVTFPSLTRERIEIGYPDLIVLDVELLVLDEWPILEELWRLATPPPVIAVSAPYSSPESLAILSHHVRGHLTKPISPHSLLSACRRLIETPVAPQRSANDERRSEPRRAMIGDVVFLTSKGRPSFSGQLLELSRNGARVDVGALPETSLAEGRTLRLSLRLPPSFQQFEIEARMEWRKEATIGVSFLNLAPHLQLWLERWLASDRKLSEYPPV
ncbi:MAG: PilZ domain-containing protein [Vicinamibacteria bacterium]|nr:PilZ domain-containing protein [Vicinamibacteria bacterium]